MRPGQRIGKYVLGERIAVGGMAEVWAARVEGPQGFVKTLALKFILESFSGDPELERLFVNEARIAAQLQHANLVTVFDFDKIGAEQERGLAGRYYIAMERVEGYDLRRIAGAAQSAGYVFPERLALHLAGEVLKALRYVHERREGSKPLGLVHRDVSPHNVLVGYSGEVKLSDFGIAKARAHSSVGTKTGAGTIRGKLSYASPEQLNGEVVDHRTDQFALGVTLWELLSGRRLFEGDDELEIIGRVVRCEIPSIANPQTNRGVDPAIDAVVRRMLSARREDRYPTTADALSAVLSLSAYSGDGAAVGDLVRTLFLPSSELPTTMPIEAPRLGDAAGLPETKTRHPEARSAKPARAAARAPSRPAASSPAPRPEPSDGTFGAAVFDTEDVRAVPRHRGALLVAVALILAAGSLAVVMMQRSPTESAASRASASSPS
ncbi:MAG TPA: serine/threonine-protein kinase, partial [Polyangia bacterium]|nr:serine/threonine-protein kinase [Polyangia bacterium]